MEKNKVVTILGILALLLFIFNIASCVNVYNHDSLRKKEMLRRLEIEEKMAKSAQESVSVSAKLKEIQEELDEEKAAHEATKKLLIQEKMIEVSLKEDLQKITKLNEALEQGLKKAPKTNKKAKK